MRVVANETTNRVFVKQSEAQTAVGSFVIPETVAQKPVRGTVMAVSPYWITKEGKEVYPVVKVGDEVLYDPYAGVPVELNGEEMLVMNEQQIFYIL
jgi:chaperonin GroES